MKKEKFLCVGQSVPRVDAMDKVLGKAVYSEDISFPDMLHGRVLRAGIPHALIEEIDVTRAEAMEGVACVLTAKEIPGHNLYGIAFQDQKALAEDKVRYAGDPVALVAAENEEIAKDGPENGNRKLVPVIARHGEGLEPGDYINAELKGPYAKVVEGKTAFELDNGYDNDSDGDYFGDDEDVPFK